MTIEATTTLPAGWYSDPAQSGGERWWDGTGWTEHLRAAEPVSNPISAPLAVAPNFAVQPNPTVQPYPTVPPPTGPTAVAPTFAAPAAVLPSVPVAPPAAPPASIAPAAPAAYVPLAPLSTGPVALAPVGAPPVVPSYDTYDLHADSVRMSYDPEVSNGAALLALLFGAIAVGLAAIGEGILPYPQVWVSLACVVGLIFGVRALVRYRRREASIRWAPTVGIILGLIATVTVFFGSTVLGLVNSVLPQAPPALTSASSAPIVEVRSEPLVFPLNAGLTAQEKSAQAIATAINHGYAAGAAILPAGHSWPASIRMSGSVVLAANGARLAVLPKGETANYTLSSDGKNYQLTVVGANSSEVANYNTSDNGFSYTCQAGDNTCTPSN